MKVVPQDAAVFYPEFPGKDSLHDIECAIFFSGTGNRDDDRATADRIGKAVAHELGCCARDAQVTEFPIGTFVIVVKYEAFRSVRLETGAAMAAYALSRFTGKPVNAGPATASIC